TGTLGSAVASLPWWLDVETANSWNGSTTANAADLQGAVDYLRGHGVPSVGLYSTSNAWNTITGGYSTATAGAYTTAWAAAFTAGYPMTQSPTWIAGAGTSSAASATCSAAGFTGPTPQLAHFNAGSGVDADLV